MVSVHNEARCRRGGRDRRQEIQNSTALGPPATPRQVRTSKESSSDNASAIRVPFFPIFTEETSVDIRNRGFISKFRV